MANPVETEFKLRASPPALAALRSHPRLIAPETASRLVSTYFDTLGRRLHRGGASLRIREGGEAREQSLKLAGLGGPGIRRGEWTAPADGALPEPSAFPPKAAAALTRMLRGAELQALASTRIERTTRRLHAGRSLIEVAFDAGEIVAGDRRETVSELELELIEGDLADVVELALSLPLGPELAWSAQSKSERCTALAFDLPAVAVRSRPPLLDPGMTVADGFRAIAWSCLDHLLANVPLVTDAGDPEALHQCRVAIRRQRAACKLFGKVVDDARFPVLLAELEAAADGLGPARDADVLVARLAAAAGHPEPGESELLRHLATVRDAAMRSASELLRGAPFQRLLFELAGWIEGGDWSAEGGGRRGRRSLGKFAAAKLSQGRRKLLRAKAPATLSDRERHRLRIAGKNLRYAASFFAPLFDRQSDRKPKQAFQRALSKLQDSLGELNDMAVAADRKDLFTGLDPVTAAGLEAQLSELLGRQAHRRGRLMKTAETALARLEKTPAWWPA